MRRWTSLAFLAIPLTVLAANVQEDFIQQAKHNGGLVKLNSKSFDIITSPDREWSVTVQLTALGSGFKCAPCRMFDPSFVAIAKAWTKAPASERDSHFFATLDFENGSEVFRKMGLNSAPFIYTYPATKGPRRPQSGKLDPLPFDFGNTGFEAASLAESLSRYTPVPIPYRPPADWTPAIAFAVASIFLALTARFILPLLMNKWFWALISIGTSLVMIAGFMFVRIRGNPYVAAGPGGRAQWIAPGYQNQFGMETQVVAFIYGILSFSCLSLILFVPRIPSKMRQSLAIYLWTGIATVVFSVLISFFRIKNPGYPFRLFL